MRLELTETSSMQCAHYLLWAGLDNKEGLSSFCLGRRLCSARLWPKSLGISQLTEIPSSLCGNQVGANLL